MESVSDLFPSVERKDSWSRLASSRVSVILDQVAGLDAARRTAAATEWNRGCRELLAVGATVLVCPGVLADLERAGARAFVGALLVGITLRPVPDTPEGYALLSLP